MKQDILAKMGKEMIALVLFTLFHQLCAHDHDRIINEVHVGFIADMESWEGKVVESCMSFAISDFYSIHHDYNTRLILHKKDSKGEDLRALFAAFSLLEDIKVETIFVLLHAQTKAKFLAELGDKARIPIISLAWPIISPDSEKYPYLLSVTHDEITQVNGVTTFIEAFKWTDVIIICDDSDRQIDTIANLVDMLREKSIRITYKAVIMKSSSISEMFIDEMHKLKGMDTKVFIVHLSRISLSSLFLSAEKLGMLNEGYVWIMTSMSTDLLHSLNATVIESMEGVIGFKSHTPSSSGIDDLTSRVRRKLYNADSKIEVKELNTYSIQAYDAIWGLAMAIEKGRSSTIPPLRHKQKGFTTTRKWLDLDGIVPSKEGPILLKEILEIKFEGLSGEFQFMTCEKALMPNPLEIVNVIGNGWRRVGLWNFTGKTANCSKHDHESSHNLKRVRRLSSANNLETIIWPGGSYSTIPKSMMMSKRSMKLKVGVPVARFRQLVAVSLETQPPTVTGFCIDVFKAATESLDYEVHFEFIPFFTRNKNATAQSYNDLVDQVYLQKVDAVVGDVTILANRSQYVDFTIPFTEIGVGIVASYETNQNMWIFVKPLSTGLWIATLCFVFFTGTLVWLIERDQQNEAFKGIGMILCYSFSTITFAHGHKLESSFSKFVVTVWLLLVFVLTSSYTANLASMMTVKQLQLNPKESYIGYNGGSFTKNIISNINFKDDKIKTYLSIEEYADALSSGRVLAILDEIPYLKLFLAKYPNYYMARTIPSTSGFGFVFPKGSPLVQDVSAAIAKLREEGRLETIENLWFHDQTVTAVESSVGNLNSLTFKNFSGLFLVSGLSSAVAFLFFLLHKNIGRICEFIWGLLERNRIRWVGN